MELVIRIRELIKAVRLAKNDLAAHSAVPSGALAVLSMIEESGPAQSKDLAVRSALDPSTISRAVSALCRAGLLERTADPADGRASLLMLTEGGRQALQEADSWYDERLAVALADWTPADVDTFAALLHRFSEDLITKPLEAAR